MFKHISILTIGILISNTSAFASGFALNEYSATSMGRAFAGTGITGDDYSAIIANPAGMIFTKQGLQVGGSLININANIKNPNKEKSNATLFSGIPYLYTQFDINEKIKIGSAFHIPYGLKTEYKNKWFGRDASILSEIKVYSFTLASSYKISSNVAFGLSTSAQYAQAHLTNDESLVPNKHELHSDIKGNSSIVPAFTLGFIYNNENTRIGLSYKSKTKYTLNGKHKININEPTSVIPGSFAGQIITDAKAKATVTLPENILLSAYHKINKLALSSSLQWTRWSRFKYLDVYTDAVVLGNPLKKISNYENWKNTLMVSAGVDYDLNNKWTLRSGFAFDESPIKSDTYRTARIPDDNRYITSLGASYKFETAGKLDIAYSHIFLNGGVAKYAKRNPDKILNAKYDLSVNMLGIAYQYQF